MSFLLLDIGLIRSADRLRATSEEQVNALMASIAEVGLLNPITVYPREIVQNGIKAAGYGIVAGSHRFDACKRLGWSEIPAVVLDLDEQRRVIAECDENLCGPSLSASEEAEFIHRRKQAYELLHPETVREATLKRGAESPSRQVGETGKADRFTADTAAKTGQSERKIQRAAERGEKVCPAAMDILRGTKADNGRVLDRLKDMTPEQQVIAARDEVNRTNRPKGEIKAPKIADAPESDEAALERQVAALMSAWNKAAPDARKEFLGRIDSPLMDKRWG